MTALFDGFASLLTSLGARRQRALLWISGAPDATVSRALVLWRTHAWQAPLWLGPPGIGPVADTVSPLPAAKARTRLGSEHDLVIFDAVSSDAGFDPDAFGAVAGTVQAGGLLVLLTPRAWEADKPAPDADYARLAAWPHDARQLSAYYLARIARRLEGSPLALHWPSGQALPTLALPAASLTVFETPRDAACLSVDQAEAVSRLTRLRRRRPLVLTADRGRGKSAALGIAAARRLQAGERQLWVTAPRPLAVEPLFARLAELLPQGRREGHAFQVELGGGHAAVRFLAPDAVIEALHAGEVDPRSPPTLFVDEAAAIPTPLLGRWLTAFPRIAFVSTVHGYEGTGRGFALRFRQRLERDTPGWRQYHLGQPVRWAAGDPLEALTRELLLLDAEPASDPAVSNALTEHTPRLISLDRATLATDEAALSELFGLLVQAHYRTTPADLRQLLDAPDVRLLTAYVGDTCLGVCLAQDEGGFPAELATAVWRGERRPRGHLLAQSLATHGGRREAAEARWCRITRIAVHPAARRRGLGGALVKRLGEQLTGEGLERLGVSFGAEAGLIDFWRTQGFVSLRLGLSREAASGEHALMMGRALKPSAEPAMARLSEDFRRLLPGMLAFDLARLDSQLAALLLAEGAAPCIEAATLERVAWFAAGGGELALVRPWLARAWLAWWRGTARTARNDELVTLAAPLFQGGQSGHDEGGRRARLAEWRKLAGRLHHQLQNQVP